MTRRVLPLAALAGAALALAALARPAGGLRAQEAPPKQTSKKLEVAVAGETVTINGKKLTLPCERKALLEVLGPPTREKALANRLLTWDELGIYAYQEPDGSKIHALALVFGKDKLEFWPKKAFAGTLAVYGARVHARTSIDALNRATKKRFERDKLLPDSYSVRDGKALLNLREPPPGSPEKVTFLEFSLSL